MKRGSARNTKKRRVVVTETYTNPLVYRDVLSLIAPHCDMQTFARLKCVCKKFWEWLPDEHPVVTTIRSSYGSMERFPYKSVPLVFDAYFHRYLSHFPERAKEHVILRTEAYTEDGEIGVLLEDGSIYDCNGFDHRYIFDDDSWRDVEIMGNFKLDGSCLGVEFMSAGNEDK